MSIKESQYTSIDSLRLLYRSPKNPLKDLDDFYAPTAATAPPAPTQAGSALAGGGVSGGGDFSPGRCPAYFEYTLVRLPGGLKVGYKFVQDLEERIDYLWNPLRGIFQMITKLAHHDNVDCAAFKTRVDCVSVVSYSHPVIQSRNDDHGKSITELIQEPDAVHPAISIIGTTRIVPTDIEWIRSAGKRSIVEISLESVDKIYASGSDPSKMNLGHNTKAPPPATDGENLVD